MSKGECLPIKQVLDTVLRVEKDVAEFYRSAKEQSRNPEAKRVFDMLLKEKETSYPSLEKVCQEIECGDEELEATAEDMQFLSVMAETAFYRRRGKPADSVNPSLQADNFADNALKLEKDLMLFYMKFHSMSCQAHRPVFSKCIQTSQRHMAELNNVMTRLTGQA